MNFNNVTKLALGGLLLGVAQPSQAEEAITLEAVYAADTVATMAGGVDGKVRYMDNLDLTAEVDLGQLVGWKGARAFVYVLSNFGEFANNGAGSVQGIDNIEVPAHGVRLYEAWIEQQVGATLSLKAGLYDLNSEFYVTDASGLLIAPPFGIGSELAGTGVAGPSIFPSTGLGVRARAMVGKSGYVQAALVNAHAGSWREPGGINVSFDRGLLAIAEAGFGEKLKLGLGAWTYTDKQDHIYLTDLAGDPEKRAAHGVYALGQWQASEKTTLFLRGGLSDGRTSSFKAGYQLGFLTQEVIKGREDSALSLGVHGSWLSDGYRQALVDAGSTPRRMETVVEATFTDRLTKHVSLQPDLQYIFNPGGDAGIANALVATLRVTLDF